MKKKTLIATIASVVTVAVLAVSLFACSKSAMPNEECVISNEENEDTIETIADETTVDETVETESVEIETVEETIEEAIETEEESAMSNDECVMPNEENEDTTENNSELRIPNSELKDESNEDDSDSELRIPNSELEQDPEPAPQPDPTPVTPAPSPAPAPTPTACTHPSTSLSGHTENRPLAGGCYDIYEVYVRTCDTCGAQTEGFEVYVTSGHDTIQLTQGYAPTCTEPGLNGTGSCSCGACGISGGEVTPATGHYFKTLCTGELSEDMTMVKYISRCTHCHLIEREWYE